MAATREEESTCCAAAGSGNLQKAEVVRLCREAVSKFHEVFGDDATPECGAYAPGRVNLMGGSIDYSGGPVVPVALQLVTVVVGRHAPSSQCRVVTLAPVDDPDHAFSVPPYPPDAPRRVEVDGPLWTSYVKGVLALLNKKGDVPPFEAVIASSVPLGGGLSSSAALEVAVYKFMEQLCPKLGCPDLKQAALLCQQAEHRYAHVPCGLMDQFVSMMAKEQHALYIDCVTQEVENIWLADPELTVLITNSGYRHTLAAASTEGDRDYSSRRKTCETISGKLGVAWLRDVSQSDLEAHKSQLSEVEMKRATHAISEIDRSCHSKEILKAGKYAEFGHLMTKSHYSLRDSYEVSVKELDDIVSLTLEDKGRVYGSHLSGGGFGGCVVTLLHRDVVEDTKHRIQKNYKSREGKEATFEVCCPSGGAGTFSPDLLLSTSEE